MNIQKKMQSTKWWHEEYNNFNATSEEAKKWLADEGYTINTELTKKLKFVDEKYRIANKMIVVDFFTEEADYRGSARQAKTARDRQVPLFGFILPTAELEKIEKEIEAKKADNKNQMRTRIQNNIDKYTAILADESQARLHNYAQKKIDIYIARINEL